jgi:L-lactate dehydrogenase complex protein LldE
MGDISAGMLAEKMKDVDITGAEVITAVDTSCLMHIFGGLHRQQAGVRMAHIAEILAPVESDVWGASA